MEANRKAPHDKKNTFKKSSNSPPNKKQREGKAENNTKQYNHIEENTLAKFIEFPFPVHTYHKGYVSMVTFL